MSTTASDHNTFLNIFIVCLWCNGCERLMYVLYDYRELKVDVIFSWEWKINNDLHKLAGDCGTRVDAYLPTSRGPRPSRPLASPPRVGALPPTTSCSMPCLFTFRVQFIHYTVLHCIPNIT